VFAFPASAARALALRQYQHSRIQSLESGARLEGESVVHHQMHHAEKSFGQENPR
jgi:hypothetical protein